MVRGYLRGQTEREGEGKLKRSLGRGVTDCLGHVVILTTFFKQLAILKPKLKRTVVGIFIANEENSDIPVGCLRKAV